jgi:hypothetical protein
MIIPSPTVTAIAAFVHHPKYLLVLAAVDGAQIESVRQDEGQFGPLAGVGQPIPAEHALATDGEVVAVGGDELEEEFGVVVFDVGVDQLLALAVHDADIHWASVEVDSAVVLRGRDVVLHS